MAAKRNKDIPMSGKWITRNPATIGTNFQTLDNLRYTATHKKGVGGMTKINTSVMNATYLKARNLWHFNKSQPAESHLLAQAYNTGLTASQVLENTTAIPSAGNFSATALWTDSSGAGRGYFSNAPDGQMIYTNSVDTCIWGGNEMNCSAFVTSTAIVTDTGAATNPKDYTEIINNTKTDADNIATIGGGNDSYTVLLLHGDGADASTTITDSSVGGGGAPPKTVAVAAGTDAQIDTSQAKFGTGSIVFDGTGDFVYVDSTDADINDFYMANDPATIDFWVRFSSVAGNQPILNQYVDADNYVEIFWKQSDSTLRFKVRESASNYVDHSASWSPQANVWYHVTLVHKGWAGNASAGAFLINGNLIGLPYLAPSGGVGWPDLNADFEIGRCQAGGATYFSGWIDEFRVSKGICRWTAAFTPPSRPYRSAARYWLVGSPRPLKGIKYYVSYGNTVASTMTGYVWTGTTWEALTLTDNTDTGAALAATGTVTFSSTVSTAKPKYLEGYFLYWYQFLIDAGEADLYRVTLDAPFQNIVDIWDGVFRAPTKFFIHTSTYTDNTIKILEEDFSSTDITTYSVWSSTPAYSGTTNDFLVGFTEKQTALRIVMVPDNVQNTAATVMTVDYWNGTEFSSVGTITDGTSEGGISLAKTGVVSWNNNTLADETRRVVANSLPLYYYRLRFDQAMDGSVCVDYIGGVTAQIDIDHYKFPVYAQGRILLCGDMAENKNMAICSSKFMPQVYNGNDSVRIYFGDDGELTCGTELFSQFGASLFSLVLMFKDNETWMMAGQDIAAWAQNTFLLSSSIGCPAPLTLKSINLQAEPGAGVNRNLAIWQGSSGIYMSDGRAPIPIHGDIEEYFDPKDSRCIKASEVGNSFSFIDPVNMEYHWCFASGTSGTATELVYSIKHNAWYRMDRGTGKTLVSGCTVSDTDGNQYTYGALDTGYVERLEYGTTFDSGSIVSDFRFGDFLPTDASYNDTFIDSVRVITTAKTTTTNNMSVVHYGDGHTTGKTLKDVYDPNHTGSTLAMPETTNSLGRYIFHSISVSQTTTDETIGFEPIAVSIGYHVAGEG